MPTDSPPGKPFFLLFLELHSKELHCLVNYYKCFISVQRFENLHWSWFSALRICPFHSKILAAALFASYRWSSSLTLPNCIVNLEIASLTSLRTLFSFSQSSNYTLWLWLHTFSKSLCYQHHSTQKLYSDLHLHLLSSSLQWLWYLVFNYNLLSWSLSELFHTNPFLLQRNPVHLYFGENPGHHLLLLRICAGLKTNLLTILYVSKLAFVSWTVGNLYTMPLIGIIILVFCLV